MQKLLIFAIFCALLCLARADNEKTLKLEVFQSSNEYWIGVTAVDAAADTEVIELRQGSGDWSTMRAVDLHVWRFWTSQTANGEPFTFPLSFRLTSSDGAQVTLTSAIMSFSGQLQTIDSLTNYGGDSTSPVEEEPASEEPVEEEPVEEEPVSEEPVEEEPVSEEPVEEEPVEEEPTSEEPVVSEPTETETPSTSEAPSTSRAPTYTKSPTTSKTSTTTSTTSTTKAPTSSSGCSGAMKMLVPLYSYPSSAWDTVIAGHSKVPTVVIVNPNSGPTTNPDSAFSSYMTKLNNAGIDMMGYVHTSYGARSISEVKSEIDTYASNWPLLKGIFLDEVSASSGQESYYKQLYDYIMGMPGWSYDVINPGAVPTSGYFSASTTIVSLENAGSAGLGSTPSYATSTCDNRLHFSAIVHSVSTGSMQSTVDGLFSKGYYGYIYITNGNAYNSLPPYYSDMVDYIASKN